MFRNILHLCLFLKHKPDIFRIVFPEDSVCSLFQIVCKIFHSFLIVHITTVFYFKDKLISHNGNTDGNRCLRHIQANRFFLRIFAANVVKFEIVPLINHHGIRFDIKFMANLCKRINIVVHGINQLLLQFKQTILCTS